MRQVLVILIITLAVAACSSDGGSGGSVAPPAITDEYRQACDTESSLVGTYVGENSNSLTFLNDCGGRLTVCPGTNSTMWFTYNEPVNGKILLTVYDSPFADQHEHCLSEGEHLCDITSGGDSEFWWINLECSETGIKTYVPEELI